MQVRAKTPHIDVKITGTGKDILVEILKNSIVDLEIINQDDAIPINSDPWFNELRKNRSSGEVLWCYRDNAGITLDELSKQSGISKTHLSEMENNTRSIEMNDAKKLAEILHCDYNRFFVA